MSDFSLYAMDHAALEALVLRVLKAIGERDRKEWAAFISELRRYPCWPLRLSSVGRIDGGCGGSRPLLTDPFEEEPLTARTIPAWDDARLVVALRELAQLSAKHRFVGGLGRMQPWLVELPLRETFASDDERAEFAAFDTLILRCQRPLPRHLEFLRDPAARVSYLPPDDVVWLARVFENGGYLRRAALRRLEEPSEEEVGWFIAQLRTFVIFAGAAKSSLYYRELYT